MAEIGGGSRDLCLPSMTIGKSSLIRSVCERPQDGCLVALIGSEVHSIVTYFLKTQTIAILTAAQAQWSQKGPS